MHVIVYSSFRENAGGVLRGRLLVTTEQNHKLMTCWRREKEKGGMTDDDGKVQTKRHNEDRMRPDKTEANIMLRFGTVLNLIIDSGSGQ